MTEPTLVAMRLRDMFKVHPEQAEGVCSSCGEKVGIYPTGQKTLDRHPGMRIVCAVCASTQHQPGDKAQPAGSLDEVLQEMRDSVRRQ